VKNILALLAALLVSVSAYADPAVKKAVETRFPDLKVEKISKTGYGNLWEIFAGGEVFYTDDKVTFVLLGQLVDAKTRENVTEARLRKLNAIPFDSLPFDQAIKTVIGNGSRRIAVFSDPYCGYCKRFEPDVLAMKDVTIYTFLLPIIRPESAPMSKKVWCSADRVKAWQDVMLRNIDPTGEGACETPVEKVLALGQMLRINGTPTTFFEDGERISGAISRDMLEKKIATSGPAKK
jgi:thiol:disulfide interchange protein DsbC